MTSILQLIRQSERISNEMMLAWTREFPHDIGVSEALILSTLVQGPEKASVLATKHHYTKAAVTHMTTKLERLHAIERKKDPKDKRATYLHITDQGMQMLQDAKKTGDRLREQIVSQLTEEERQQFASIQERILDILTE